MAAGESLKQVYDEYKKDPAFVHLRKGRTFVPGTGSRMPAMILVGEAPGEQEDREGVPFVGKSGQVLEKMLQKNCLEREMVFITNVIKWQPEGNRTPTAAEIEAAKPYLRRELAVVARKYKHTVTREEVRPIVCFLGKTAALLMGKEFAKATKRGTVVERKGWRYAPLYHPAVALYDPKMLDLMHQQFANIAKEI